MVCSCPATETEHRLFSLFPPPPPPPPPPNFSALSVHVHGIRRRESGHHHHLQSSGAVWKSRWPNRPALPSLISLMVSVDAKQHWNVIISQSFAVQSCPVLFGPVLAGSPVPLSCHCGDCGECGDSTWDQHWPSPASESVHLPLVPSSELGSCVKVEVAVLGSRP